MEIFVLVIFFSIALIYVVYLAHEAISKLERRIEDLEAHTGIER